LGTSPNKVNLEGSRRGHRPGTRRHLRDSPGGNSILRSAKEVDRACRDTTRRVTVVLEGRRRTVYGAASYIGMLDQHAARGHVWLDVAGHAEWVQVPLKDIHVEKKKGASMPLRGKRQNGRPTHVGKSRKGSKQPPAKQPNIPGVDVDSRRIAEIEDAWDARTEKQAAVVTAQAALEEADRVVVETMHKNGFSLKKRPTYTRVGFGSIVLKETGKIQETVRFVALKPKKKAAKKAESNGDGES